LISWRRQGKCYAGHGIQDSMSVLAGENNLLSISKKGEVSLWFSGKTTHN
jgi:hypothetical protein